MTKFIHLLYVPTMNCNMACRYCYLSDNTKDEECHKGVVETLEYAIDKFASSEVMPFNISLHGGEVTTLGKEDFRNVIQYIDEYYRKNGDFLRDNGFKVGRPHIKTNLYDIEKHLDTIREFEVSISGSLDLPLSLHREHRRTKGNTDTLDKILKNIELLRDIPCRKKVSATIFDEHFRRLDEICEDIKYLHENTPLDMNDFNFMIGFEPQNEGEIKLTALSEENQVALYRRMHEEFENSDLSEGLNNAWFAEFTPSYCTNCDNCGEKFFLLERSGDIYSCVRGQKNENFYYGNIYTDSVEEILKNAKAKIFLMHNNEGFSDECINCKYLHLCKTGCPYVKNIYGNGKSYTCLLQKELYKNGEYEEIPDGFAYRYAMKNHPEKLSSFSCDNYPENGLEDLISKDERLQYVYSRDAFILEVDGQEYKLESQLTKSSRDIIFISKNSNVKIYIRKEYMDKLSDYPSNNALYMMLLSGDMIVYGDEQREKQAHIMTHQIFKGTLEKTESLKEGFYSADIGPLLSIYADALSKTSANNLFFTTTALRDYHYTKQKNNAFYHINAMNLPFQNIELYFIDLDTEDNTDA